MKPTSKENAKAIFQQALSIYQQNSLSLIGTGAVTLVPLALLSALIHAWLASLGMDLIGRILYGLLLFGFVLAPAMIVASLFAQAAVLVQLNSLLTQQRLMSLASAWGSVMRRVVPLLTTLLFVAVGAGLGLLVFVVPGIWILYRCLFVVPVTLFESKSGWAAILRSSELVKQSKEETIVVLLGTGLISLATQLFASFLLPQSISGIGADLLRVVVMPLPMIGLGLLYRHVTFQPGE